MEAVDSVIVVAGSDQLGELSGQRVGAHRVVLLQRRLEEHHAIDGNLAAAACSARSAPDE